MDINPQDFFWWPFGWEVLLLMALAAWGIGTYCARKMHGFVFSKKVSIVLFLLAVFYLLGDLRALFPDQRQYNAVMEAIVSLFVLVAMIWVMWIFFIKKPKP